MTFPGVEPRLCVTSDCRAPAVGVVVMRRRQGQRVLSERPMCEEHGLNAIEATAATFGITVTFERDPEPEELG